ncbi:MAG: tetratricopeptide repeat protein, partial [Planctomycetota bacterium]
QRGMVLNNIGIVHKHRMEYSEALAAYKEVYTVFETIGEKNFMAFSLGNMGITQRTLGQYQEALTSMELAKSLFEEVKNVVGVGMAALQIGAVFTEIDELEFARQNISLALQTAEKAGFKPLIMDSLLPQALLEQKAGDPKAGLAMAERALVAAREAKDRVKEMMALSIKADLHRDLRDMDAALVCSNQAVALADPKAKVEGVERVWLNHHRILKANFDPAAVEALEKARSIVKSIAASLGDEDRERFQATKLNQEILAGAPRASRPPGAV